jgi:protein MPE1
MNALPNAGRREKNFGNGVQGVRKAGSPAPAGMPPALTGGETEEERIAAMFQASSEQWNKTQEHMAKCVYSFVEYDRYFELQACIPEILT